MLFGDWSNRIVVRCFGASFEPVELNRPILGIFKSISLMCDRSVSGNSPIMVLHSGKQFSTGRLPCCLWIEEC